MSTPIDTGDLPIVALDAALSPSELFVRALHYREEPAYWPLLRAHADRCLATLAGDDRTPLPGSFASREGIRERTEAVRTLRRAEVAAWSVARAGLSRELCQWIVQQAAPAGVADGCLLRTAIDIRLNETALGCAMLLLYANEVGGGQPARHHGETFRALAASLDIELPGHEDLAFAEDNEAMSFSGGSDLLPSSFAPPTFFLALSAFPTLFLPEIVGANLHYHAAGLPPPLAGSRSRLVELGASPRFLDLHALPESPSPMELVAVDAAALMLDGEGGDFGGQAERARRMETGFLVARALERRWSEAVDAYVASGGLSVHEQMARLIARRAAGGLGYHPRVPMAGCPLDQWLERSASNPSEFLAALARSRWIRPGNPDGSSFLTQVTAFGGPMFGIFSDGELSVVRRWISSLPVADGKAVSPVTPAASQANLTPQAPRESGRPAPIVRPDWFGDGPEVHRVVEAYVGQPLSRVYAELLEVETRPKVLPFAKAYVDRWLERARRLFAPETASSVRFDRTEALTHEDYYLHAYDREWLNDRIDRQHRKQRDTFKVITGHPGVTREDVIAATSSVMAGSLLDGVWLQSMGCIVLCQPRLASALFKIYADELGFGQQARNHNIGYRQTLESMGIELPPVISPGFVSACRLPEAGFALPLFWLAISQFPKRYFPEILGLTLSIEVWGVGGNFRTDSQAMTYYGFDSYINALHNTIDNVDNGHTKWALDATHALMSEMRSRGGEELADVAWRRVWNGVCAWACRASASEIGQRSSS